MAAHKTASCYIDVLCQCAHIVVVQEVHCALDVSCQLIHLCSEPGLRRIHVRL